MNLPLTLMISAKQSLMFLEAILVLFYLGDAALSDSQVKYVVGTECIGSATNTRVSEWDSATQSFVRNVSIECPSDHYHVLQLCNQIYPGHDFVNVESLIDLKCDATDDSCPVLQYHCVENTESYLTSVLSVPNHCQFNAKTDFDGCLTPLQWQEIASNACGDTGRFYHSGAVIRPCDGRINHFKVFQFVCCQRHPAFDAQPIDEETETLEIGGAVPVTTSAPASADEVISNYFANHVIEDRLEGQRLDVNVSRKELSHMRAAERLAFILARDAMKESYEERHKKIMEEWQEHVATVRQLRLQNPSEAVKQLDKKYAEMYAESEQERSELETRLRRVHAARRFEINKQKRALAMEKYLSAFRQLESNTSNLNFISHALLSLRHYINVEETDRQHAVHRFKHLTTYAPHEAEREKFKILDHLELLDRRIRNALRMLQALPVNVEVHMRQRIENFQTRFETVRHEQRRLLLAAASSSTARVLITTTPPSDPPASTQTEESKTTASLSTSTHTEPHNLRLSTQPGKAHSTLSAKFLRQHFHVVDSKRKTATHRNTATPSSSSTRVPSASPAPLAVVGKPVLDEEADWRHSSSSDIGVLDHPPGPHSRGRLLSPHDDVERTVWLVAAACILVITLALVILSFIVFRRMRVNPSKAYDLMPSEPLLPDFSTPISSRCGYENPLLLHESA